MKKVVFSLLTLVMLVGLAFPGGSVFAATTPKEGKQLAKEFVKEKDHAQAFNALTKKEKEKLKDFSKKEYDKVLKKIEKITGKDASVEKQTQALEKIWNKLSPEERLAYTVLAQPVTKTYETHKSTANTDPAGMVTMAALANETSFLYTTVLCENIIGTNLWTYIVTNTFVHDGVQIHSINPSQSADIHYPGWRYRGTDATFSAFQYNRYNYVRNQEGLFEYEVVLNFNSYMAHVDYKLYADGRWTATEWMD